MVQKQFGAKRLHFDDDFGDMYILIPFRSMSRLLGGVTSNFDVLCGDRKTMTTPSLLLIAKVVLCATEAAREASKFCMGDNDSVAPNAVAIVKDKARNERR